jgi:drug/metabolite transporter (DMT)-like permease
MKNVFKLFNKDTETKRTLFIWGSVNALKAIVFIIALKNSSASIISSTTNFMSVAVVIVAYFYLKERQHMYYKWAAAVIGVAGLVYIAR